MTGTTSPSTGYIRIFRNLWDHPAFRSRGEASVFAWMISAASWKPTRVRYKDRQVNLCRGQLAISTRDMASDWEWSESKVRRFLERLKNDDMIDAHSDAGVTVITICNYSEYQHSEHSTDAPSDAAPTQDRRTTDAQNKKDNKLKELNNNKTNQSNQDSRVDDPLASNGFDGSKIDDFDKIRKAVWRQHGLTEDKINTKLVSASLEGLANVRRWLANKLSCSEILDAIADTYTAAELKGTKISNPWTYLDRVMETVAERKENPEPEKPNKLSQDEIWRVHMVEFTTRIMKDGKPLWFENLYGPQPGQRGCKVPDAIMAEFGVKPYWEPITDQTIPQTAPNGPRTAEATQSAIRV